MRFLFILDPIDTLKVQTDTSLLLAWKATAFGHNSFFCEPNDLFLLKSSPYGHTSQMFFKTSSTPTRFAQKKTTELLSFDAIFIRKDPPFDQNYLNLCWFLKLIEEKVYFMNRPTCLLHYHEKLLPYEMLSQKYIDKNDVISCLISSHPYVDNIRKTIPSHSIIVKPFLGHGGRDVKKIPLSKLPQKTSTLFLYQPFLPHVQKTGDRRVFFVGGEFFGEFTRLPKKGDFVSNLAYGGSATKTPLTQKTQTLIKKVGKFLKDKKIDFAGIDVIDDKLSEVNITSPTGIPILSQLENKDYGEKIIKYVLKNLPSQARA